MMQTAEPAPILSLTAPHRRLRQAITELPPEQRIVLVLFQFERLPLEEIAMVLDESEDEVAARLYLAYVAVGMAGGVGAAALQVA